MNEHNMLDLSVLYAEDEATPREVIAHFLKRRVKKLVTVTNGEEGLVRFREERPDLVVTDIHMPVMDGLKMARVMRAECKDIPVIVTTMHSDTSSMVDAIDIGVDQYVLKPIDTDKLSAAVEKCADAIELRRAHKRYLAECEKLIADLQKALAEIKTLQGILPICCVCKKIRDDAGSWTHVESYIREHSDAEFSHGYCPECGQKAMEGIKQFKACNSDKKQ